MKGKRILGIPVSSANPFTKNINTAMANVAKEVGFTFTAWENQGQPSQWVQGMNYATNNKYDLIDLLGGTDPKVLAPQVKAATDAGIKVIASHYSGFEQPVPPGASGVVPIDYLKAGQLLADWTIAKTGGSANALVIVSTEVNSTESMINGIKDEFEKHCENCKHKIINVPIPEWSTKIQSNVQSSLLADPSINYIIPIYDSMSQFVVPAVTITGRGGSVKDRDLQRHALRPRPRPAGPGGDGHRREPGLDRPRRHGRRDAHPVRPGRDQGPEDPVLHLRQVERELGGQAAAALDRLRDWAATKAAYRFFSNDRVSEGEILARPLPLDARPGRRRRRPDHGAPRHDRVLLPEAAARAGRPDLPRSTAARTRGPVSPCTPSAGC